MMPVDHDALVDAAADKLCTLLDDSTRGGRPQHPYQLEQLMVALEDWRAAKAAASVARARVARTPEMPPCH